MCVIFFLRIWVHPINKQREEKGVFHHLIQELQMDSDKHHKYFRMSAAQLEEILSNVGPDITKQDTNYRSAIQPNKSWLLSCVLRFILSALSCLAFSYRLGETTVSQAITDTCAAIITRMMPNHMSPPKEEDWRSIAERFMAKWNFPHCLGAIDGKHISIQAPPRSGSLYFNYKKHFSIVLMAVVDADYRFRVVQTGDYGRSSDGGVFASSALGRGLEAGNLSTPADGVLPGAEIEMPYVIVGDAAFPLKTYLMRPFSGRGELNYEKRIFNYRLSRARNVVENAFGILAARWRIFLTTIYLHPRKVDAIVLAACTLHNFLCRPGESLGWLEEQDVRLRDGPRMGGGRGGQVAERVRDNFCRYFVSPQGSVPWQNQMV
uniref:DDE Tnp4 domain-containing protein n=1 Tax=Neogobius melanostomus TaxID=47308 RepID=A0A8C6SPQ9_9GOBI